MSFAWTRRAALGGLLLAACNPSSTDSAPGGSPSARADGGADASEAAAITFYPTADLCSDGTQVCATPSADVAIGIAGAPGEITLSLEGDYGDATLGADDLVLGATSSQVTLHAASMATTFRLVARYASDATRSASLGIAVSAAGFAEVRAVPSYGGHRWSSLSTMYATVTTQRTCGQLAKTPLPDGPDWVPTKRDIAVLFSDVPAGTPLAVDVRVGHYAYGCVDVPALPASPAAHDAPVDVFDLPMDLDATNLDATFAFAADAATTSAWQASLATAAQRVEAGFFATGSEAGALLDAVRATIASPSDQQAFDASRSANGWDAATTTWLGTKSLHAKAAAWLDAQTSAQLGPLSLHVASGTTTGTAEITASSFGVLSASAAAIAPPTPFAWSADGDDTVHLSGAIDVATNALVAHLADLGAPSAVANAADVPSALALWIDAAGLAQKLVGPGVSYGACAAACTADAFRTAISRSWSAAYAPSANAGDTAHFTLAASAPATVGDTAQPIGFAGSWSGQAGGAAIATAFALKGQVSAQSTAIH